jgi:hypothetical protein
MVYGLLEETTFLCIFFYEGKKKSDPNFIGDEKIEALKGNEEPVIFEVKEFAGDVKRESDEEKEETTIITEDIPEESSNGDEDGNADESVDWESFNKVRIC